MFKTTNVDDTNLTLAVILFNVRVNNSLFFLLRLPTNEENFVEFPLL